VSKSNRTSGVSTKRMTSHRTTFDMYEVITPYNVYLDDDSIVEVIGMGSIVLNSIVRGKINQIIIIDAVHLSNLQANFLLVSKLVLNGLNVQFNLWKLATTMPLLLCHMKRICAKWILRKYTKRKCTIFNRRWCVWAFAPLS